MIDGKRINGKLCVQYVFDRLGLAGADRIRYRPGRSFSLQPSTGLGSHWIRYT